MTQAIFNQFIADNKACIEKAEKMFGVNLSATPVQISFNIRGGVAGRASHRYGRFSLAYNPEAVVNHTDEMTKDTIPHEVAHLVCFANPKLGRNHDAGWKRVCRMLGGDDSRTHDMVLTPGKAIRRYEYNVNGEVLVVGPKHHKAIQGGATTLYSKRSRQTILASHFVRSIGHDETMQKRAARREQRTGQPQPAPQPIQVPRMNTNLPLIKPPTPQFNTGFKTKRQLAEEIFKANPQATRAQMIKLFMAQADMTANGAATYYYNIKNGK